MEEGSPVPPWPVEVPEKEDPSLCMFMSSVGLNKITELKVTSYITALSTEKSNALEYFRDTKNYGKSPLRLAVHVSFVVQTARSQLHMCL